MIGQLISHYRIVEKLGEGGMGVVYKAQDTQLDRFVALKFLPNYLSSDAVEKERFYHEARATSALSHPNITTIYEIAEHDHQLYMAMEYVEGVTLKKLVEKEVPSVKKVLDVAIQACDGLSLAHEKNVVHRDIKSDNIMMTPKGQVKIMDFGLAKVKGATKLTKAGSTLGTAAYMSPEQAQGEEVDPRSDIFSFGVVLYELLTGHLPFRGEHQAAIAYSLINEDPQPLARFNNDASQELERIVMKALEKDKRERYQHIDDLQADLRKEMKTIEYARTGYVRSVAGAPPAAVKAPAVRPWLKYAIPAGVVVVLLVVFVFSPFNVQIKTDKTVASPNKSLAVMYFQNIPDPDDKDHTGDMLADLLITSLSQTRDLEVVSRERLYDIQKQFNIDSKIIAPDMATKIAERAGVTTMLLGSILQREPTMAVTARVVDVKTGKILSSERVIGYSSKQIFALVDTLALLVRNDLRVTSAASTETQSVADVTTSSTEAYRSYIEGMESSRKFYGTEALAAFKKAIELDSSFAMAYFGLASSNADISDADRSAAVKKAYALSAKVPDRERLLIESAYVGGIENNPGKAAQLLEKYLVRYPHEDLAYFSLADDYARAGQFDKALETCQRAVQADSLNKLFWNSLAYAQAVWGRRDEALSAIDQYLRLAPAEPNPYDSRGDIYFIGGDVDSAVIWWKKALTFRSDFPSSAKLGVQYVVQNDYANAEKYLAQVTAAAGPGQDQLARFVPVIMDAHGGRMNGVREYLTRMAAEAKKKSSNAGHEYWLVTLAALEQGDYASAEKSALLSRKERIRFGTGPILGRDLLAYAFQMNGRSDSAAAIINDLHREAATMGLFGKADVEQTEGLVAYAQQKYEAALGHFDKAMQSTYPNHGPQYYRAAALLKVGRRAEAIREWERYAAYSPIQFTWFDTDFLLGSEWWMVNTVKAHYWLGVAYEEQGETRKAVAEYEKFLSIWKDADFKSVELEDARLRLAKLK